MNKKSVKKWLKIVVCSYLIVMVAVSGIGFISNKISVAHRDAVLRQQEKSENTRFRNDAEQVQLAFFRQCPSYLGTRDVKRENSHRFIVCAGNNGAAGIQLYKYPSDYHDSLNPCGMAAVLKNDMLRGLRDWFYSGKYDGYFLRVFTFGIDSPGSIVDPLRSEFNLSSGLDTYSPGGVLLMQTYPNGCSGL